MCICKTCTLTLWARWVVTRLEEQAVSVLTQGPRRSKAYDRRPVAYANPLPVAMVALIFWPRL